MNRKWKKYNKIKEKTIVTILYYQSQITYLKYTSITLK